MIISMLQLIEDMQLLKRFCVFYEMFKNTSLMKHLRGTSIYCTTTNYVYGVWKM